MSADYAEFVRDLQTHTVVVPIHGTTILSKKTIKDGYGDTFQWIAGPAVHEFYERNGLEVSSMSSSKFRDITFFFFPKGKEDVAALFKLTFGGK